VFGGIVPEAFASSTQTVFYAFAGVMAVAFLVALRFMPAGKVTEPPAEEEPEQTPAGAV
jgi:membrane associated rhomboid family serine protease